MHYSGPKAETLHQRYAQALIEVAEENNRLDRVKEDLEFLNNLVREDKRVAGILYHPEIEKEDKIRFLESICEEANACQETRSFIKLLVRKNRLRLIHGVFLRYRDIYDVRKHQIKVFVKTAVSLSGSQLNKLETILKKKLNKDIFIEEFIEPSLISGFNLKIGSLIYNLSLTNRLWFMKERLRGL